MQESRFASTLTEVSRRVPIRYATLIEKRKHPDFPPDHSTGKNKYDVITIREWLRANRVAHNSSEFERPKFTPDPRQVAYAERAKAAAEREKFKLDIEMGEYLPRMSVQNQVEAAHHIVRRELVKALEQELPPRVANMNAAAVKAVMRAKLREILSHMSQRIMGGTGSNGNGTNGA